MVADPIIDVPSSTVIQDQLDLVVQARRAAEREAFEHEEAARAAREQAKQLRMQEHRLRMGGGR
jgi:hypothetical protein